MERFKLDEYLKDTSRKVVTRDGRNVRIVCTDVKGSAPIVAVIEEKDNTENVLRYESDGIMHGYHDIDLFFAPDIHVGWINIHKDRLYWRNYWPSVVYSTEEEAKEAAAQCNSPVFTTKVEWEE